MRQKERNRALEEHKGELNVEEEDRLKKKVLFIVHTPVTHNR